MSNYISNNKKKILLARKEKLLEEIQYYEKRITDFHANKSKDSYFEFESSDSETDFPIIIDNAPPESQLKLQQAALKTSLLATQELTGLEVLQSEVNILTSEPTLEYGPPVREDGLWHEVAVQCRVDRVSFGITFLVHQPDSKFGARSFRNVTVIPEKAAHKSELSKSVLALAAIPSDALDLVKSYAAAHRSRRTSLARLAEKYAESLFMEPMTDGGYLLRCAGLLEVCWTLENRWSAIAQFQHRMKFELEYMDESYVKIITHLHGQLSDPSLKTDERTLLLSKIISTCLEAKAPTQELYESMESDPETAQKLRKRRTTLDQEVDVPEMKKKKDNEVMAPPKTLPKKTKPKGKENNNLKRPSADDGGAAKKLKLNDVSKSLNEKSDVDGQKERKSTKHDKVNQKDKSNNKIMTEVTNTQSVETLTEVTNTQSVETLKEMKSAGNGKNKAESKNKLLDENKNTKSSIKSKVEKSVTLSKKNDEVAIQSCTTKSTGNDIAQQKSSKISKKSNVQNVATTENNAEEMLGACPSKSINKNVDKQCKPKLSKKSNVQNVGMSRKMDEDNLKASAPKSNSKNQNKDQGSKESNSQKNVTTSKINDEVKTQSCARKSITSLAQQKNSKVSKKSNIQNVGVETEKNCKEILQTGTTKSTNKNFIQPKDPKVTKKSNVKNNDTTTKKCDENTQIRVSKSINQNVPKEKNLSNKKTADKERVTNSNTNINKAEKMKLAEKAKKDSNKLADDNNSADMVINKNMNEKNIVEKNKRNKEAAQIVGTVSKSVAENNTDQKVDQKNKKVAAKSNLLDLPIEKTAKNIKVNAEIIKTAKINQENNKKAPKVIQNKGKILATNKIEFKTQPGGNQKVSKIPQKKITVPVNALKKNPLRISPKYHSPGRLLSSTRKQPLKMMPSQHSVKAIRKSLTSIPRFQKQRPKT